MNKDKVKILIAYFSHSGNTHRVATEIQNMAGGDLFEIKAVDPYPQDYNSVTQVARSEQISGRRPTLTAQVDDMASYDVIILGYPNWWSTMPMAVFTFLEQYDFSGKQIMPFCTHEGSRLGISEKDIMRLCPKANVLSGLAIRGSSVKNARAELSTWLKNAGLI